tara:strand:- start:193 stop:459 length:267 start_codon:yes stop_codon:yes gene_type:complete
VIIKRADITKSLADKFIPKSSLLPQQIGYIKYPQLILQLLIAAINHKQFQKFDKSLILPNNIKEVIEKRLFFRSVTRGYYLGSLLGIS